MAVLLTDFAVVFCADLAGRFGAALRTAFLTLGFGAANVLVEAVSGVECDVFSVMWMDIFDVQ